MRASRSVQAPLATLRGMLRGSTLLFLIAAAIVVALAVAIHLFGPALGHAIHGG
jgi:hypothetical protein